MPDNVRDSSAICALDFVEPNGQEIAKRVTGHALYAPALLQFEVANVCLTEIRQRIADTGALTSQIASIQQMQVISADVEYGEVLPLAETMGLSFYDASYP